MNKRKLGAQKEQLAADYLTNEGYKILAANYRCRKGEIDIIATNNGVIIFVEVKYRGSSKYGLAIEAVSPNKQNTIRQVAINYLVTQFHKDNLDCRFDVIGIDNDDITHIKNAF